MFAGVFAGAGGDFGGEEVEEDAVLVGAPDGSVAAEEACARAFFASETEGSGEESVDEPFEADGDFDDFAAEGCGDAVDNAAADEGLSDGGGFGPLGAV